MLSKIHNNIQLKRYTYNSAFFSGKLKNLTGTSIVGEQGTQSKTRQQQTFVSSNLFPVSVEHPEFASPNSSMCLSNHQSKISSVFESDHGLQPPTSNAPPTLPGMIPKTKSNQAFSGIR